jgi:hypothetical protein
MDAAAGKRPFAPSRAVYAPWLVASTCLMLAGPCWSQDTPVWSTDLPPPALQAEAPTTTAAAAPVPRLSLTLGTPLMATRWSGERGALDLGVQWRQPVANDRHVDVTAWRRMTPEFDAVTLIRQREPVYGARVEMNLQGRKRGLVMDKRFLGLQLDSGTRITLRRKNGNPTLYYRSQF